MRRRLYRLFAALLLAVLPWQAFAGASMVSCAHAAATAQPAAGAPCHDAPAVNEQETAHEGLPDLAGWSSCSGCAHCHACSASVLPMAERNAPISSPLRPGFAPPAAIAGVVLEHLDPPPVG